MGNSHSSNWKQLREIPISFLWCMVQPIYVVQDQNNDYILIAVSNSDKLIKYELTENKYININNTSDNVSLSSSTLSFDSRNKTICAVDAHNGSCHELHIDEQKNEYKHNLIAIDNGDNKNNMQQIGLNATSCYISDSNKYELHIIGGEHSNKYFKYNHLNNTFSILHKLQNNHNLSNHGMVYLLYSHQILIFGGLTSNNGYNYHDHIFCYDCTHCELTKLNNIRMPLKIAQFGYIVYNDRFIIIFGGKINSGYLNSIYIFDTNKFDNWMLSEIKCPIKSAFYAIITKNDSIHLFERDSDAHKHWVLHIDQLKISTNENDMDNVEEKEEVKHDLCNNLCTIEFERFMEQSLPDYLNYLDKFAKKNMNNVRYINFLTANVLTNKIKMDPFHQTVLLSKIDEYKIDYRKFKTTFKEINMFEKYYGFFDKNGIISYWSFYYHITTKKQLKNIVPHINEHDLKILWQSFSTDSKDDNVELEGTLEPTAYI
eukprot:462681_1